MRDIEEIIEEESKGLREFFKKNFKDWILRELIKNFHISKWFSEIGITHYVRSKIDI